MFSKTEKKPIPTIEFLFIFCVVIFIALTCGALTECVKNADRTAELERRVYLLESRAVCEKVKPAGDCFPGAVKKGAAE